MSNATLKSAAVFASLMSGVIAAPAAHAIAQNGTLGASALATDVFRVTCPVGTSRLSANVLDTNAIVNLGVTVRLAIFDVHLTPATSPTVLDDEDPNPPTPSAITSLVRGSGQYYMYVWKSAGGAESYTVNYNCLNAAGAALASAIATIQTQ